MGDIILLIEFMLQTLHSRVEIILDFLHAGGDLHKRMQGPADIGAADPRSHQFYIFAVGVEDSFGGAA